METDDKYIIIPDYLIVVKWLEKGGKCIMDLYKDLGISYKHLHAIKKFYVKNGWATIVKNGMRHDLYLTEKGHAIKNSVDELLTTMGYTEANIRKFVRRASRKPVINNETED